MKKIICIVLLIVLMSNLPGWTQDISRVGTAAAQFLKLGVGARAAALGEAAVTLSGEIAGLYWNPSSIASIDRTSFAVSRNDLYAGLSYNFIGLVQPLGQAGAIGISAVYFDSGEMEITTLQNPEGTESYFSWDAYAIGLTFSRFVTDRLALGGTIKYIHEGAYHVSAQTIAIDLGSLLDTGVLGMKLGMCLSNFGGQMRLGGPTFEVNHDRWPNNPGNIATSALLKTQDYPLPLTFRIGLSTQLLGAEGQIARSEKNVMTIAVDAYDPNDALLRSNFGVEYQWNNILSLRAGYRGISVGEDEFDSYDTASYTFGGGLQYDFNFGRIVFDYAFTDFKILGSGHMFTIALGF